LREQSVVLTKSECSAARRQLTALMGSAARLCIRDTALSEIETDIRANNVCRAITASEVAGAMLVARTKPHTMWRRPDRAGGAALEDSGAIAVPIEMGDSVSASTELGLALFRNVYPATACPSVLDEVARARMRADVEVARIEEKARYFVLAGGNQVVLTPELESWLTRELGAGVLVCQPGDGANELFLYEEKTLLALIARFLQILDAPEWNPS
jgi:hypothetical protein